MAKSFSGITPTTEMPDWLLGGKPEDQKFLRIPKDKVQEWIESLMASRPSCTRITGITGNTIEHPDIAGRPVAYMLIDDFPRTTGFEKGDSDSLASNQVVFTDDYSLTSDQTVILIYG